MATKADLEKRVEHLEAQVKGLLAHIAALHSRLGLDSTTSSRPPSSDGPSSKPGEKHGHEGHAFENLAPEDVSRVVPLVPTECGNCGEALPDAPPNPRAISAVFQHIELPVLKLVVVAYHHYKRVCPCCTKGGKKTRAPLPPDVGAESSGPPPARRHRRAHPEIPPWPPSGDRSGR